MILEQLNTHKENKNKASHPHLTLVSKNQFKMDHRPKCES